MKINSFFFTGDNMIKIYSRLASLESFSGRPLLCRTVLGINLYTGRECSSKLSPCNVKINNEDGKNFTSFQVLTIIESVHQFGFEESEMKTLMNCQPQLMKTSANSWRNVIQSLMQAGFDKNNIFTILEKWPSILYLKENDLNNKLIAWMKLGFGSALLSNILTTHPYLLDVDINHVTKTVKQYQLQFESKRRVGKLLFLAPNILEESWEIVCNKLNYLNELCTDNSDIVASGVLAHSLFHIKARHEFLIRAGVYKRPQKDFVKRLSKNPSLDNIVNTTDDEFVSKVAGLSLFEYNVFLDMFEEELRDTLADGEVDSDDETIMYKLNYKKNINK